jgi:hypothetical protein
MGSERVHQDNSSWNYAFNKDAGKNQDKQHSFGVPNSNTNPSLPKEIPAYSRASYDLISAKILKAAAGKYQQELPEHQATEVSNEPVSLQLQSDLGSQDTNSSEPGTIQRACAECESEQETERSIQAKLSIGSPGDKYEQEADAMAEKVMSMDTPTANPQVQRQGEEPEQPIGTSVNTLVQRFLQLRQSFVQGKEQKADTDSGNLENRLASQQGGGSPLDAQTRSFMEPRFSLDFNKVRVHTDSTSVQMNQELGAQAFTHGHDVYFGAGKYHPGADDGKRLLAHELTHVVQQTGAVQRKPLVEHQSETGNESKEEFSNTNIPKGSGEPLPDGHREAFEQVLQQPLDNVRIHTGDATDQAAKQMGAEAFTVGSDIYFANGSYAPGNPEGDKILSHELTHVTQHQQGQVPLATKNEETVSKPTDPLETEAYAQENKIAKQVGQLRGEDNSSIPESGTTPPPAPEEKIASKINPTEEKSDSGRGESSKDEELIPQQPEQPSPFAVTEAPPPQATVDVEPVAIPIPQENVEAKPPAAEAAVVPTSEPSVESPAPSQAVDSQAAKEPEIASNEIEPPTQPAIEPMQEAVSAVPESEIAAPDVSQTVTPQSGEKADPKGKAIANSQADALIQESQNIAQNITTTGASVLDTVKNQITELTASVQTKAQEARSEVTTSYAAQQAAVEQELATTLGAIAQSREQQHQAILTFAQTEKQRFETASQTERESATTFIAEKKQQTLETGETEAARAITGSEEKATNILGEAAAVNVNGDPPSVEAQQKATRRIADDAAQKCRQAGTDLAQRVRQEAQQHAGTYDEILQKYLQQLTQTASDINGSFDQFISSATNQVDGLAQQATTAAQQMGNQSKAALEAEKNAALAQIDAWEQKASNILQQQGTQLEAPLNTQISSLQQALTGYGANAAAQLRSLEQPDPQYVQEAAAFYRQNLQGSQNEAIASLQQWQTQTQTELTTQSEQLNTQLSQLVSDRTTAAQETGAKMVQSLQEAAQNAATGMTNATTKSQQELTTSIDEAVEKMKAAGEQYRSQVESKHQEAITALTKLVDDGLTSQENLVNKAKQEMSSAVGQISSKYDSLKSEAQQRSDSQQQTPQTRIHRGIWGDITSFFGGIIDSVKKWFADTFGEFWGGLLFGILAGLVIVGIGWLAMTGLGALLVAIGVSAKVAAIVAIVVGLVIAIPLGIYNRFQEFYADNPGQDAGFWRGLGLVALGILDLTGIPFVIEGIVGQRAFGKELKGFERWERFGMGLVFIGAFLVSAKNLLRSKPKPPIEEPPIERPPIERPPIEEPPIEKPSVGGGVRKVPLDRIRYSQKTVKSTTGDGTPIEQVAENMRQNGWDETKPAPDMVDWGDGGYQTLDHRRLVAAKQAGNITEVPANIHAPNEPLPSDQIGRFRLNRTFTDPETNITYQKGSIAQTWGEAAMFRSANQGKNFPIRGSQELPRVSGGGGEDGN